MTAVPADRPNNSPVARPEVSWPRRPSGPRGCPRVRRADLLAKLDGLGEYDVRRPMTATGTNLLGLVNHVAPVAVGYLDEVFGRPSALRLPWLADDGEPDADMGAMAAARH